MKISNEYIESAVRALTTIDNPIVVNEEYSSVFKGYISSLGASIIQAGLLPSIILYENSPSAAEDKSKLIRAIQYVLSDRCNYHFNETFSKYIINHPTEQKKILSDVEKATIAIKLALRIFKTDNNQNMEE